MARGMKKLKKWTTISLLLSSARYSGIHLMCQTIEERILTQQQRERYEGNVSVRPYGAYIVGFIKYRWGDENLSLGRDYGIPKCYKFVLDTPSKRYARGKVVFKNEDSDA